MSRLRLLALAIVGLIVTGGAYSFPGAVRYNVPQTSTAFAQGFDFRATSGFVTDVPPNQFWSTALFPTVTAQGNNAGWDNGTGISGRDRNSGNNPSIAGIILAAASVQRTFKVTLPAPGVYKIRLAIGDASNALTGQFCQIFDNTTLLATPVPANTTIAANSFKDATGTTLTAANWPSMNTAASLTFATTSLIIQMGSGAGNDWSIAYLGVSQ